MYRYINSAVQKFVKVKGYYNYKIKIEAVKKLKKQKLNCYIVLSVSLSSVGNTFDCLTVPGQLLNAAIINLSFSRSMND